MLSFILRRLGTMALTMLCLTLVVFFLINLDPNLKKLAISQTEMHTSAEQLENWLVNHGYRQNFFSRYGQWLGIVPKQPVTDPATGKPTRRFAFCNDPVEPTFSGVLQGDFGCSTKFKTTVASKLFPALGATGILMFWVLVVMVPISLLIGILAGMREGSRTDRTLSVASIASTATPEYVSGVIFTVIFASWLGLLNGSAASASRGITFGSVVVKHALRNALIAPFTVIMLQFPWLLTGVVIVEVMFRYQGFGYTLVEAAGNNDIDLLLGCSLVSVFIVLITQLISDVGYAFLNPRIRVQ